MLTAVIAVLAVAILGLLLRRLGGARTPTALAPDAGMEPATGVGPGREEGPDGPHETVAVTSDGWSFVPFGERDRVRLMPPVTPAGSELMAARGGPEQLARGDLIAARVKRGAPDHDPWRLEALGRDHEYRAWRFETEEAARAALALVERCIVRAARDEDGEPIAVGDAEFAEARRREEEIESELAAMTDLEAPDEHGSRRPIE
jgi:hypothetical protein